jgi:hypothetical protein
MVKQLRGVPLNPHESRFIYTASIQPLKRALEVAITGGLSIAIIGVGASYPEALSLIQVARHHGLVAYCLLPCLFGAAHLAEAIQYRRRQPFVTKPVV